MAYPTISLGDQIWDLVVVKQSKGWQCEVRGQRCLQDIRKRSEEAGQVGGRISRKRSSGKDGPLLQELAMFSREFIIHELGRKYSDYLTLTINSILKIAQDKQRSTVYLRLRLPYPKCKLRVGWSQNYPSTCLLHKLGLSLSHRNGVAPCVQAELVKAIPRLRVSTFLHQQATAASGLAMTVHLLCSTTSHLTHLLMAELLSST